ncbi:hypothetical protein FHG87_006898 [Trinorchestia longiramus]|nr:hypothetical protein FHG87_006898 [Trinorchestia longiramus]
MRTYLIVCFLVAGCVARPRDLDIDAFNTAVEESIPTLLESVAGKSPADAIRPLSDSIINMVREHIPEEDKELFRKNVELTDSRLDQIVDLVRQIPRIDFRSSLGGDENVDLPVVVVPEIEIAL